MLKGVNRVFRLLLFCLLVLPSLAPLPAQAAGPFNVRLPAPGLSVDRNALTVVGQPQDYTLKAGENLLDIARKYGLGYLELGNMYRDWDPFLPPAGARLIIPTIWIVPSHPRTQIVVNTGEMRMYFFTDNNTKVITYPIGMGVLDFKTPTGKFTVVEKKTNPAWHIPANLQAKYGMAVMAPGPDNPLGEYKLTLSGGGGYGLHGTHMPWGVGRLVSHGCTRMYPEHIKALFPVVNLGTTVEYIYEPVMIGFKNGHIYLSVNQDYYHRIPDMLTYTLKRLETAQVLSDVNLTKVMKLVEEQWGVPTDVTKSSSTTVSQSQ
jgi:L,D-transpeptidase ErfK/SrfK